MPSMSRSTCTVALCCLVGFTPAVVCAQDVPEDAPPAPAAPPEPEIEIPPAFEPPPLPSPTEDFSADQDHFGEVVTPSEQVLKAQLAAEKQLVITEKPLYLRHPVFAKLTEAAAGVFGAGIVGLLGGTIGNAIDEGDDRHPLGGFHGPAIGGLTGTYVGASLGVWGAGELFDKDANPGWSFLGAGVGTIVGGAAAFGVVSGLDEGDGANTLAVALLLGSQVLGAILFQDAFAPEWKPQAGK